MKLNLASLQELYGSGKVNCVKGALVQAGQHLLTLRLEVSA